MDTMTISQAPQPEPGPFQVIEAALVQTLADQGVSNVDTRRAAYAVLRAIQAPLMQNDRAPRTT